MENQEIDEYGTIACISGGGAAQIENALGCIKAIVDKRGVKFDRMMGTSAGAIVASVLMSLHQNIDLMIHTVKETNIDEWYKIDPIQAIKSLFGRSNYIADNTGLKNYLIRTITPDAIRRVSVAMTKMDGTKAVGTATVPGTAPHVLASMAFQHIFPPVKCNGVVYTDGGIFNLCPLPCYMDLPKFKHVYIILAAKGRLMPEVGAWPILNSILSLVDDTMDRECSQIAELKFEEAPNITVIRPPEFVESSNLIRWSKDFEQIEASYLYASQVLDDEHQIKKEYPK